MYELSFVRRRGGSGAAPLISIILVLSWLILEGGLNGL